MNLCILLTDLKLEAVSFRPTVHTMILIDFFSVVIFVLFTIFTFCTNIILKTFCD